MSISINSSATSLPQQASDSRPVPDKARATQQPDSQRSQALVDSSVKSQEVVRAKVDSASNVTSTTAETTRAQQQREQIDDAIKRASQLDHRLTFQVDEDSGKSVVVVRDAQTSEVLKQFPSEEMLNVARRLEEQQIRAGASASASAGSLHADEV